MSGEFFVFFSVLGGEPLGVESRHFLLSLCSLFDWCLSPFETELLIQESIFTVEFSSNF